ncbi:MAG: glutamate-cysteine ligase family protein [Chloroflexales bacterium]|jgi:gamma-glutamyl:cysteine ligase YbdK (ATP-grasp superfamily)
MFHFGIEHEVAFVDQSNVLVAWTEASYTVFRRIIAALPLYPDDAEVLHIGDAGVRVKRWYIEGLERYDEEGRMRAVVPKGIEIRTTPSLTIIGAVDELRTSFARLRDAAAAEGLHPVLISFNPTATIFRYDPPLNVFEQHLRQADPDYQTEALAMLTYGPDLNISMDGMDAAEALDIGRKLTAYSPYIVPFSFSSPFYDGHVWDGLSVRTFYRTGQRPAAYVFVATASDPPGKLARNQREVGRIEFKAFDSCADFGLYGALLALLKGIALDQTLVERADVPDAAKHQHAARSGFADDVIANGARQVLAAATQSLANDADATLLIPLAAMIEQPISHAHALIAAYAQTGSRETVLRDSYIPLPK